MLHRNTLIAATLFASLASTAALAHQQGHDEDKPIPTTCAHLADTKRYTNDVAYPEVKALKARCDAQNTGAKQTEAGPAGRKK